MPRLRDATGQASVEFVAVLPLVALVAGALWQAVVTGQAVWVSAGGGRGGWRARAAGGGGSRARAVGGDAAAGARATLPASLRRGARVAADRSGVRVDLSVPLV